MKKTLNILVLYLIFSPPMVAQKFYFGAAYYPEQEDKKQIVEDIKKGETASVVTGSPSFQSLSSILSSGTYPIIINQGTLAASNYEFQMVDGELTVNSGTDTPFIHDESNIKVYPNPCSDYLIIENNEEVSLSIFSDSGKKNFEHKGDGNKTIIPVAHLSNGIYFIQINKNSVSDFSKFIINK